MASKEKMEMLKYYNKGLELYKSREFAEAVKYFKKCQELVPGDGPSNIYIERSNEYIKNPPPENWDGVYKMTTK